MQTKRAEGREGLGQNHKTAVLDAKKKEKNQIFFSCRIAFLSDVFSEFWLAINA
jgi:hypothetical protein